MAIQVLNANDVKEIGGASDVSPRTASSLTDPGIFFPFGPIVIERPSFPPSNQSSNWRNDLRFEPDTGGIGDRRP